MSNCQSLTSLPDDLSGLYSLEVLILENCRSLKTVPESIIELRALKELNLDKCRSLRILPENFGNMKALENLKLKRCTRLKEIPKSLGNQKDIEILDFSYCYHLVNLPDELSNLKALKKLRLRGCRELKSLPHCIGNLTLLAELDLYACGKLKSLPESIGNLTNLKKLELSYCNLLLTIPESIKNIDALDEVNIDGCDNLILTNEIIDNLQNLKTFRINEKRTFPYKSESDNMYNIRPHPYSPDDPMSPFQLKKHQTEMNLIFEPPDIFLSDMKEKLIKSGVCPEDAEILEIFYVFIRNKLEKAEIYEILEEDFDDMQVMRHFKIINEGKVVELHLHFAEAINLTVFPRQLCSLDELEVIRFPNNLIEEIPECITKLKSLRVLDLSNYEKPTARIPIAITSFIHSLEDFNRFYNF
ncbi:MAG: leucine-rich repeat domain-containing protein [Promethearchaeota archaeon]